MQLYNFMLKTIELNTTIKTKLKRKRKQEHSQMKNVDFVGRKITKELNGKWMFPINCNQRKNGELFITWLDGRDSDIWPGLIEATYWWRCAGDIDAGACDLIWFSFRNVWYSFFSYFRWRSTICMPKGCVSRDEQKKKYVKRKMNKQWVTNLFKV